MGRLTRWGDFLYTFSGEIVRTGIVFAFLASLMTFVAVSDYDLGVIVGATLLGFTVICGGYTYDVNTRYRYHFKFCEEDQDEVTRFIVRNRLWCGGVYPDFASGKDDFVKRILTVPIVCYEDYCLLKMRF